MLTTVLFDMGGTLEDIWNNEQTRSEVMTRLAQELREQGIPGSFFVCWP